MKSIICLSLFTFGLSIDVSLAGNYINNEEILYQNKYKWKNLLNKNKRNLQKDDGAKVTIAPDDITLFASGLNHNCVEFTKDGKVRCWGANDSGQLGLGDTVNRGDAINEMGEKLPFVNLGKKFGYLGDLTLGGYHSCASNQDERAKCWGNNRYGQLGLGDTNNRGDQPKEMGDKLSFIDLGAGKGVMQIIAGFMHTCVYLSDGNVVCFGNNEHGQLGLGDTKNRGGSLSDMGNNLVIVALPIIPSSWANMATGPSANHTCIAYTSYAACWGSNESGQLGLGDTNNRGDQPNEMGSNLQVSHIPDGKNIYNVFIGGSNTCLYGSDRNMYCFGNNAYGQLGIGSTKNIGDGANEMGNNLKPVSLGTGVKTLFASVGSNHICIAINPQGLKCFGNNAYGQLGQGDNKSRGSAAATIGDNLPYIDLGIAGSIYALRTGDDHTCVLIKVGEKANNVKCFGDGSKGALGYGDTNNRGDDVNEMGINLPNVYLRFAPITKSPSQAPTFKPVKQPTRKPTKNPTPYPTRKPANN